MSRISKHLLEKALSDLPIEDIEDRLAVYSRGSHFNSISERTYSKFMEWKKKYGLLLLEVNNPPPSREDKK